MNNNRQLITNLNNAWTANVRLKGGQTMLIWWTSWQSTKHIVSEVLSLSSDLPKQPIDSVGL